MKKRSYLQILQEEVPSDEMFKCLQKAFARWAEETYETIDDQDQERFLGTDYRELAELFIEDVIKSTTVCNWSIGEEFEDFEFDEECEDYLADIAREHEFIYEIKLFMHKMIEEVA